MNDPFAGIDRLALRGTDRELLLTCLCKRLAGRIAAGAVDHQAEAFTRHERRANLLQRPDPALDATRIDEEREPRHRRIPELLIEFEEGKFDRLPAGIQQTDVLVDLPATHGSGEMDVELQQIL